MSQALPKCRGCCSLRAKDATSSALCALASNKRKHVFLVHRLPQRLSRDATMELKRDVREMSASKALKGDVPLIFFLWRQGQPEPEKVRRKVLRLASLHPLTLSTPSAPGLSPGRLSSSFSSNFSKKAMEVSDQGWAVAALIIASRKATMHFMNTDLSMSPLIQGT